MSEAELFACTDTHHFIRGEVDETRQDEEITKPKTADREKLVTGGGEEEDTVHTPLS